MIDIPQLFTEKQDILSYDFNNIDTYVGSEIDEYVYIDNLSIPGDKKAICTQYFQSIVLGYNHIFIDKMLQSVNSRSNISLPLLHKWEDTVKINNVVIISHPDDAERICKDHVKKAPIFKSFLYNSIISTTDNDEWKEQRGNMNMAFIPKLSLQKIFPISLERAQKCVHVLKSLTDNYTKPVNMSDFFLHETQAQLQLSMFGFSDTFQETTNKKLRQAFAGINVEYVNEFAEAALQEASISKGPLSKLFDMEDDKHKNIGNMIIFSFAGHDTTGHTLSWLLYELCKHPTYKQELIREIDTYWLNHREPTYDTFKELPFMTKCITETLRLWPALANGTYRELEHDEIIKGIDTTDVCVPKGTYCQIINWTRHRNPELWGPDVDTFNPYRDFKDEEIWNYEGFNTYNVYSNRFSPFTYGPRNCIGKNFSQMEMRLILLHICKHYDFSLTKEQREVGTTTDYKGFNTFTMGPGSIYEDELLGMYVDVVPRKSKL